MDEKKIMSTEATFKEFKMQSLLFEPLNATGSNFSEWTNNVKVFLHAERITQVINKNPRPEEEPLPESTKWHTLMVFRRHMDRTLRLQYLHIEDPAELWAELHARYDHHQLMSLPQTRAGWSDLRVMDFPNFTAYDMELHRIISQLWLSGQEITDSELIEKTLSISPPAMAIISMQYMNMKYKKYAKLMSHLLLAEK